MLFPEKIEVDGVLYGVLDDTADTADEMVDPDGDRSIKYDCADALRAANEFPMYHNSAVPAHYLDAARIAIPILNDALGTWTETGNVVVGINASADGWLVTGQYWTRDSDFGPLGVVVLARKTGEVLYVGFGLPQ